MMKLHSITYSNEGKRINYGYVVDGKHEKYFSMNNAFYAEYDVDVSSVPPSIAVIPFLSSVMPIAWFLGFDVYVDDVDKDFLESLDEIKIVLSSDWSDKHLSGELKATHIQKNTISGSRYMMLYSGGVDALTTYLLHREQHPDLVTILGADIPVNDDQQWEDLLNFINAEELLVQNRKYRVKCNFRDFYTYNVDLLVDMGWWGKVQHGLALLGVNAPLSFVNGYKGIYIASSQVDGFAWGSQPKIDDKVLWADLFCRNDGSELTRQKKVDLIVEFKKKTNSPLRVRVCYSELNKGLNCSRCEKCYRTILAIIFAGDDPNRYGFSVHGDVYDQVYSCFEKIQTFDLGLVNLWKDIEEKAKSNTQFFVFEDEQKEEVSVQRIASGALTGILLRKPRIPTHTALMKYAVVNKYKRLYGVYRFIKKSIHLE